MKMLRRPTGRLCHLPPPTIAAFVAAFESLHTPRTGPFGPNHPGQKHPPPGGGETDPAFHRNSYTCWIGSSRSRQVRSRRGRTTLGFESYLLHLAVSDGLVLVACRAACHQVRAALAGMRRARPSASKRQAPTMSMRAWTRSPIAKVTSPGSFIDSARPSASRK